MKGKIGNIIKTIGLHSKLLAIRAAKPFLKNFVKSMIVDYKDEALEALHENVDIPKLEPAEEAKLWENMYNGLQPALLKIIDRI